MNTDTILKTLIADRAYMIKTLPLLKGSFFTCSKTREFLKHFTKYIKKYKSIPTNTELKDLIYVNKQEREVDPSLIEFVDNIYNSPEQPTDYIYEQTEKFIKIKTMGEAIITSAEMLEDINNLPIILTNIQTALKVGFDNKVAIDLSSDIEKRWQEYNKVVNKIPTLIEGLDQSFDGGVEKKTLNALIAPTNAGKSTALVHLACNFIRQNLNVLYITLEMAEEKILRRIESNLLDIEYSEFNNISLSEYQLKINTLLENNIGKIYVKEFPTGAASVHDFQLLIDNIKQKNEINIDVVMVDYVNIMKTDSKYSSTYVEIKKISEQLRGFAVENNLCVWTCSQTNRNGYDNLEVTITDVSESIGLPATLDSMIAIVDTKQLRQQGKQIWTILKSRYGIANFQQILFDVDFTRSKYMELDDNEMLKFNITNQR